MNKIISSQQVFSKTALSTVIACVALVTILLVKLPAVQGQQKISLAEQQQIVTQQSDQGTSGSQLRIDVNPLLSLNVLAPSHTPSYYDAPVTASGEIAVNVGNPCPSGYTTEVATVGLAWIADSGAVDIQFVPTQQRGHSIGLLMWDLGAQRWWCTDSLSETNTLHFDTMSQGIYFMWVVTQDKEQVVGDISVNSPPPSTSS